MIRSQRGPLTPVIMPAPFKESSFEESTDFKITETISWLTKARCLDSHIRCDTKQFEWKNEK